MYSLICGSPPFLGDTRQEIFQKIVRSPVEFNEEIWNNVSDDCKDLIKKMLKKNPSKRIVINDVLSHSWFKKFCDKSINKVPLNLVKSLLMYNQPNKLRQGLMKIIIRHMNFYEIQNLNQIFSAFDTSHTGKVSYFDIFQSLKSTKNPSVLKKLKKSMKKPEAYKNYSLAYSDFILATLDMKKLFSEELLQDVYDQLTNVSIN